MSEVFVKNVSSRIRTGGKIEFREVFCELKDKASEQRISQLSEELRERPTLTYINRIESAISDLFGEEAGDLKIDKKLEKLTKVFKMIHQQY